MALSMVATPAEAKRDIRNVTPDLTAEQAIARFVDPG
jgi:hypothetical protein